MVGVQVAQGHRVHPVQRRVPLQPAERAVAQVHHQPEAVGLQRTQNAHGRRVVPGMARPAADGAGAPALEAIPVRVTPSTATASNALYRTNLAKGQTGLSVAFDLPTQMGYDSDEAIASGEVGKVGVAIDSLEDMRVLFDGIPLAEVSTSMTINAPAAILLLLYELVGEEQGVPSDQLRGTVQNDVLKEYIARGNYIYPPVPTMRLTTDLFAYCREHVPRFNAISRMRRK